MKSCGQSASSTGSITPSVLLSPGLSSLSWAERHAAEPVLLLPWTNPHSLASPLLLQSISPTLSGAFCVSSDWLPFLSYTFLFSLVTDLDISELFLFHFPVCLRDLAALLISLGLSFIFSPSLLTNSSMYGCMNRHTRV